MQFIYSKDCPNSEGFEEREQLQRLVTLVFGSFLETFEGLRSLGSFQDLPFGFRKHVNHRTFARKASMIEIIFSISVARL